MSENQTKETFEEEKPQIVHLESNESHYEYCRMQMHDIEHVHRRTFICNMILCIFVCFLAIFHVYIGGFGMLSIPFSGVDDPGAILAGGIFQIIISMAIMVAGYLAWANFHTLNIILEAWYVVVTALGIFKLDYATALIGVVGAVFYYFSFKELKREQALSEMEGYPEFTEKFDISKSDIVIQTLLAHQHEKRTKSTLFTTDYSLRKKKKKAAEKTEARNGDAGTELAEELKKHLDDAKDARQVRTAIATLDAAAANQQNQKHAAEEEALRKKQEEEEQAAKLQARMAEAMAKAKAAAEEDLNASRPAENAPKKAKQKKSAKK
ncbi:MAG: hypothetical protein MJ071_05370 [Oscillospiraceae bacterium]|nr:hypothetical protein [Oscillospiraceae bacterium]